MSRLRNWLFYPANWLAKKNIKVVAHSLRGNRGCSTCWLCYPGKGLRFFFGFGFRETYSQGKCYKFIRTQEMFQCPRNTICEQDQS